jgi:hypothetical protein
LLRPRTCATTTVGLWLPLDDHHLPPQAVTPPYTQRNRELKHALFGQWHGTCSTRTATSFSGINMKNVYRLALAAATLALSNPASAAVVVTGPDTATDGSFSLGFSGSGVSRPTFSETFSFTTTVNGLLSAIISTTGGGPRSRNDVDFTRVFISGTGLGSGVDLAALFGSTDVNEVRSINDLLIGAGTYSLTTEGTASGSNGSYGGSVSFSAAAVPETATWMMMLAGFGVVGFGMRRRGSVKTTVSYA